MKWIERAIRPAPRMAPRGQIMMTAGEPAARRSRGPAVGCPPWFRACASRSAPSGPGLPARGDRLRLRRALFGLAIDPTPGPAQGDRLPEGTISKIEFEGNATIPPEKIKPKLLSRVGQPLDQDKVEADLKSLLGTKWFSDVRYLLRRDAPRAAGSTP